MEQTITTLRKALESGVLQAIAAFLIISAVLGFSIIMKVRDSFAGEDNSNSNSAPVTNRQPTPARVSNDGDKGSSTPPPTITPTPTATIDNSNKPANSSGGSLTANSNTSSSSRYTWRATATIEIRDSPSDYGNIIETIGEGDGLIMIERKSESSKWYKVTSESGNTGWIDGNFIEEK